MAELSLHRSLHPSQTRNEFSVLGMHTIHQLVFIPLDDLWRGFDFAYFVDMKSKTI